MIFYWSKRLSKSPLASRPFLTIRIKVSSIFWICHDAS